jgi:hypothetical protein
MQNFIETFGDSFPARAEFTKAYFEHTGNYDLKAEAAAWKASGFAVRRGKGGRAAFYDYLRNGGRIKNEQDLLAYIASDACEFSDNERKASNYGHWLAIAELVEAVRF